VPWLCYLSFIGNTAGALARACDVAAQIKRQPSRGCVAGAKSPGPVAVAPDGNPSFGRHVPGSLRNQEVAMNAIIYLVGLVVVVLFILSFIGLR
jgi:hypothetical protein